MPRCNIEDMLRCPSVIRVLLVVRLQLGLFVTSENEVDPAERHVDWLALSSSALVTNLVHPTRSSAAVIDHSSSIGVVASVNRE